MGLESVADAGPLIHLSEIGALSVFSIFATIYVPDAVRDEVRLQGHINSEDLLKLSKIHIHILAPQETDNFIQQRDLTTLHRGEQAALFLCQTRQISILLTDDLAARQAAQRLGVTPVGSLGVIVRAFRDNLLSQEIAEDYLHKLYSVSSLFVTSEIVELAIEHLRAAPPAND